jgi:uncharacterized protein
MNQAFHLYRLQQIDTQIDQVMSSLTEIEKLLSGDETIKDARRALDEATKLLHQDQQALKNLEYAVKEQQIKIAQCESSLYGGKIRNPKELQDIQKEITSVKKYLSTLEDQQLDAMMTVEEKESQVKTANDNLNQALASFAEKSSGWSGQKSLLLHQRERLNSERTTATPPISADFMKLYENIRKRKSGVAVTTAHEGSCSVCGASIRPMELQLARNIQDVVYCTSCGRILYVG